MGKLFIMSGNDEFSVKEKALAVVRELCGDSPENCPSLEVINCDSDSEAAHEPLARFLAAVKTPPFLSPDKTVWLKHYPHFQAAAKEKSKKDEDAKSTCLDEIAEFLKEGFPDDLTVIIDGPGMDRRKSFTKTCEKVAKASGGDVHWFDKADPKRDKTYAANLQRRIKDMVSESGKRIASDAAAFMFETIGGDSGRLRTEVDKLCAYAGDAKQITLDDCMQICSRTSETLAWEFSGALMERNLPKAFSLIPTLIERLEQEKSSGSGRPEMAVIAVVSSEFEKLLSVKRAGHRLRIPRNANADYFYGIFASKPEDDSDAMLGSFFSLHPFRAFKMWENAVRFKDTEFADAFEAIFEANLAVVTGGDPKLAIERMASRVAAC